MSLYLSRVDGSFSDGMPVKLSFALTSRRSGHEEDGSGGASRVLLVDGYDVEGKLVDGKLFDGIADGGKLGDVLGA
jgi:hypothetical protein